VTRRAAAGQFAAHLGRDSSTKTGSDRPQYFPFVSWPIERPRIKEEKSPYFFRVASRMRAFMNSETHTKY